MEFLLDRAGLFFYGPARSCLDIARVDHGLIGSWPWSPPMGALPALLGSFPIGPWEAAQPSALPCLLDRILQRRVGPLLIQEK